jgi:hypothetical protein
MAITGATVPKAIVDRNPAAAAATDSGITSAFVGPTCITVPGCPPLCA